jgi:RNA polymerase sigma factor (sigma-70 family)
VGSGRPSSEPETKIEDEERKSIVRSALQMLKPVEQRILFLTLAKGLNPREIALKMDMKPEDIRNRKSRALKIVQREIEKKIRKERQGHL